VVTVVKESFLVTESDAVVMVTVSSVVELVTASNAAVDMLLSVANYLPVCPLHLGTF